MDVPRALIAAVVAAGLLLAGCGSADEVASSGSGRTSTTRPGAEGSTTSTTASSSSGSPTSAATGSTAGGGPGTTGSTPAGSAPGSSGSAVPGDPGPETPVSSAPGTDDALPEPTPTEVPNRHDLIDPRPHTPEKVVVDPGDPTKLHVQFWGGIPQCHGAEVTVRETATQVVVALRSGALPGGPQACIDLAQYQQVTVTLAAPLGTRTIRTDPA